MPEHWMDRQCRIAKEATDKWPEWMRREAGLKPKNDKPWAESNIDIATRANHTSMRVAKTTSGAMRYEVILEALKAAENSAYAKGVRERLSADKYRKLYEDTLALLQHSEIARGEAERAVASLRARNVELLQRVANARQTILAEQAAARCNGKRTRQDRQASLEW